MKYTIFIESVIKNAPVASSSTTSKKYCMPIALFRYRLMSRMKQMSTKPYSSDSTPLYKKDRHKHNKHTCQYR